MSMTLWKTYKYALNGAIERLKTLIVLRDMCAEVNDMDTYDEYDKIISTVEEDIKFLCSVLELDYEMEVSII